MLVLSQVGGRWGWVQGHCIVVVVISEHRERLEMGRWVRVRGGRESETR